MLRESCRPGAAPPWGASMEAPSETPYGEGRRPFPGALRGRQGPRISRLGLVGMASPWPCAQWVGGRRPGSGSVSAATNVVHATPQNAAAPEHFSREAGLGRLNPGAKAAKTVAGRHATLSPWRSAPCKDSHSKERDSRESPRSYLAAAAGFSPSTTASTTASSGTSSAPSTLSWLRVLAPVDVSRCSLLCPALYCPALRCVLLPCPALRCPLRCSLLCCPVLPCPALCCALLP